MGAEEMNSNPAHIGDEDNSVQSGVDTDTQADQSTVDGNNRINEKAGRQNKAHQKNSQKSNKKNKYQNNHTNEEQAGNDPGEKDKKSGCNCSDREKSPYFLVKINHSSEIEICDCSLEEDVQNGDKVVVPTKYGSDLGVVLGKICEHHVEEESVFLVERKASEKDLEHYRENKEREKEAYKLCLEKIKKHDLDMKLVSAHYLLDDTKVLFFFTADARVDFRDLVKDLVSVFKMRIELRQIGVRDEARVVGGMGVCGRAYCCHGVSDKLRPVSIKMAKEQNLSLNSMKISGPCGRLLCCLSYEYDYYHEERKKYPSEGTMIKIKAKDYRLTELNMIKSKGFLLGPEGNRFSFDLELLQYNDKYREWKLPAVILEN